MTTINLAWTVNDLLRELPESGATLNRLGIDTCCGGSMTLTEAAESAGTTPAALIEEICRGAGGTPAGDACEAGSCTIEGRR
ncbi:MAG TPA: DUF542 domain-containing protein [Gemmatimonadales bacterium]|nr:DUF542 domain-containing protein [Gemmatimonadales bacterium]